MLEASAGLHRERVVWVCTAMRFNSCPGPAVVTDDSVRNFRYCVSEEERRPAVASSAF